MIEIIERLKKRAILAPMAGYTDTAFRTLCMEYGAAYCVTEMVSAKGLVQGNHTARGLLAITPQEAPCAVQLFSDEPKSMEEAAAFVCEQHVGVKPFMIDINCGCPARKVAGHGSGAALMKTPELAVEICAAAVRAADVPVSVKFRLGWDDGSRNAVEFANRMEAAGASLLTVHGRTRAQMYASPVDLAGIAAVKQTVKIPVIANGDVVDGLSAKRMLEETGCDGVMVGRSAFGRPWFFAQIAAYLERGEVLPEPEPRERTATMLRHVRLLCANEGDALGMRQARKITAHYFKGLHGAAEFRSRAVRVNTLAELEELAAEVLLVAC
ncbi:MAG: tRNA dihydrouridine synthase DusB [Oscillospiraceae bacterium]|jgi:nifR3 family TIM-barrel protein|nr:tRNA dihydrouridine synthase DusB [Oscillospiraceae bacterium]